MWAPGAVPAALADPRQPSVTHAQTAHFDQPGAPPAALRAQFPPPAVSAPARAGGEIFQQVERRLRELGATYYLLETWGNSGQMYRFHCKVSAAGNPEPIPEFRCHGWRIVSAPMRQVLEQVEQYFVQGPCDKARKYLQAALRQDSRAADFNPWPVEGLCSEDLGPAYSGGSPGEKVGRATGFMESRSRLVIGPRLPQPYHKPACFAPLVWYFRREHSYCAVLEIDVIASLRSRFFASHCQLCAYPESTAQDARLGQCMPRATAIGR